MYPMRSILWAVVTELKPSLSEPFAKESFLLLGCVVVLRKIRLFSIAFN